jgi:hypothetical protein
LIVTSPFAAALAQLVKNAALPGSAIAHDHPELIETFRAAAIQSFEYTYELAIRMMRCGLETIVSTPAEIDQMPFKTPMRTAAEKGWSTTLGLDAVPREAKHHVARLP